MRAIARSGVRCRHTAYVGPTDSAAPEAFEALLETLNYPMFVVTASADGHRAGCLVGFTTQVSIQPGRFLVALSNKNHTFQVASKSARLAVHALPEEDDSLARLFGEQTGDQIDKFAQCAWYDGPGGVPILDAALAWFSGTVLLRLPLGDHTAFVIEPDAGEYRGPRTGLLTFGDVHDLDAGHDA